MDGQAKVYTYSLSEMRSAGRGETVQPQTVQSLPHGGSYSAVRNGLLYLGTNVLLETPALRLLYLLPLVWLLLESRKRRPGEVSSAPAPAV